jgi:hypothetical protein
VATLLPANLAAAGARLAVRDGLGRMTMNWLPLLCIISSASGSSGSCGCSCHLLLLQLPPQPAGWPARLG